MQPAVNQPHLLPETHPYGHPRFLENVSAAYGLLHTSIAGSPLKGVTGADVTQLLGMLVSELPPPTADALLRRVAVPSPHAGIAFTDFYASVATCVLYAAFVGQADALFRALDVFGLGAVDKALCEAALAQLQLAAFAAPSPASAGVPEAVAQPLLAAIAANADRSEPPALAACVPLAEFVRAAGALFLRALEASS